MKVGKRQQQGRGKTQKELCWNCSKEYLESSYAKKNSTASFKKVGGYCPECGFSKIDGKEEYIRGLIEEAKKVPDLEERIRELETRIIELEGDEK